MKHLFSITLLVLLAALTSSPLSAQRAQRGPDSPQRLEQRPSQGAARHERARKPDAERRGERVRGERPCQCKDKGKGKRQRLREAERPHKGQGRRAGEAKRTHERRGEQRSVDQERPQRRTRS